MKLGADDDQKSVPKKLHQDAIQIVICYDPKSSETPHSKKGSEYDLKIMI